MAEVIRTHLTAAELALHGRSLRAQLSQRRAPWGLLGWSFRGPPAAIALEVKISGARGRKLPRIPTLRLPRPLGGRLRLRVVIAGGDRREPCPGPVSFGDPELPRVCQPVAPGAPIVVRTGRDRRIGGIAAVLVLDGRLHLLTCGHLFDGDGEVYSRDTGAHLATLRRSYLRTSSPLDAAVCELAGEGESLLAASTEAPTWFRGHRAPSLEDNDATADFWPTHRSDATPLSVPISACSATTTVLFANGPFDDFIELGGGVIPGDSGSLLAIDGLYLGLCSGHVQGAWSYFTPIAAVLRRLADDHQEVALWHPDRGARF